MADSYVGRFAPSPTGPLHFGSLVSALASYLDARAVDGRWLVRIEDIDPPREVPGAADTILAQLEQHGLEWDDSVLYQSRRVDVYREAIGDLQRTGQLYACSCSRERIRLLGGPYDGHCRDAKVKIDGSVALRLVIPNNTSIEFDDIFQGPQRVDLTTTCGDFIVLRRDRLIAYQLAVSIDDGYQQITDVIRGSDLLDSTPRQLFAMRQLGQRWPAYGHIPVALDQNGQKLSKQNRAPILAATAPRSNIFYALEWLRQSPPEELRSAPLAELLHWGIAHWRRGNVPAEKALASQPLGDPAPKFQ